jgi:hypothetical protein
VRNHFRRGARFIADARHHCRPLDRNERFRVRIHAKSLERRTKAPGCRNGVLGDIGLRVLDALQGFQRVSDGLCCPSYVQLMAVTGLCRQSVATGIKRLEAAGILDVMRRLVREVIDGVIHTRQGSNLYAFRLPSAGAIDKAVAAVASGKPRAFQKPAFAALAKMLGWGERRAQPT